MEEYTSKYLLGRDYNASTRLNLQHFLWKEQQGFLLHPSISLDLEKPIRIADVGTGTGVWANDVARLLPETALIEGFDVDISQAPPKEWLPPNVRIREIDFNVPLPEDLVEQFDVVQIRLFILALKDGDPRPIVQKAWKMLKPGGYFQWSESDVKSQTTEKANESIDSTLFDTLQARTGFSQPTVHSNWVEDLAEHFERQGLVQIQVHRSRTPPERLLMEQNNYLMILDEVAVKRLKGRELEEYLELVKTAGEQVKKGICWNYSRVTTVGKKPAEAVASE